MKRRLAALGVALIIGTSATLVAAAPAEAHSQWTCTHGTGCLFQDVNGGPAGAPHLTLYWSVWGDGECHNLPSTWYDTASSVVSDYGSGYDLVLYENTNCNEAFGDKLVSPRSLNFTGWWAFLNDDVQSFKIVQ